MKVTIGLCTHCRSSPTVPSPKMLTGTPLMVISKRKISTLWHIRRPNGLHNKIPNFYFFLFQYFFSSTCGHDFGRTVARKSSIVGFVFVQGARHSENLQHLQIVRFIYKIIKSFPANTHNRLVQFATNNF